MMQNQNYGKRKCLAQKGAVYQCPFIFAGLLKEPRGETGDIHQIIPQRMRVGTPRSHQSRRGAGCSPGPTPAVPAVWAAADGDGQLAGGQVETVQEEEHREDLLRARPAADVVRGEGGRRPQDAPQPPPACTPRTEPPSPLHPGGPPKGAPDRTPGTVGITAKG